MNARYGFSPMAGPSHSGLSKRDNRAAPGLGPASAAAGNDDEDSSAYYQQQQQQQPHHQYHPYAAATSSRPHTPGGGINQAYSQARTAEDLEGQNDEQLEGLNAKVKMLKNITIGIGNEVRDSTKFLDGMNDTFGETSGFLGGTFNKMNAMARRQGGRWWYWMLFIILVFWIFFFRWIGLI